MEQKTGKEATKEAQERLLVIKGTKKEILERITCSRCGREYEIRPQHQTCPQCNHTFRPREPLICPGCGHWTYGKGCWRPAKGQIDPARLLRKYWQVGPVLTCSRCGCEFVHRGKLPIRCPDCGHS